MPIHSSRPLAATSQPGALRTFLKAGHAPTLGAAFFYFMFSCAIWVMNGTMAPFISEAYQLSPAQKGLMLSIPIFAGALMRFPLGILAQYIGRKNATLVEMGGIAIALLYGYFFVQSFNDLLAMGVLLGIAGASFGVALSLGGGLIPNAMGLSKQHTGSYLYGFVAFALCAAAMLTLLRFMQIRWTRTWAEKGGRARSA